MFFRRLSPRAKQKRMQRIVFGILAAVLALGLIGSSIAWTGLVGGPSQQTETPKNAAERVKFLEEQSKKNPNDKDILVSLAANYSQLGQLDKASETYQKVLKLDPKDISTHQDLAVIYYAQGKKDLAEQQINQALGIEPNNPNLNYQMAKLLAEKKDYKGAIGHMEKLLDSEKKGPRADEARKLIESWKSEAGH